MGGGVVRTVLGGRDHGPGPGPGQCHCSHPHCTGPGSKYTTVTGPGTL